MENVVPFEPRTYNYPPRTVRSVSHPAGIEMDTDKFIEVFDIVDGPPFELRFPALKSATRALIDSALSNTLTVENKGDKYTRFIITNDFSDNLTALPIMLRQPGDERNVCSHPGCTCAWGITIVTEATPFEMLHPNSVTIAETPQTQTDCRKVANTILAELNATLVE